VVAVLTRVRSLKTSSTLWALLVWAYKRQGVQFETDRASALQPAGAYAGDFLGASGPQACEGWEGRGCINGAGTIAHPDAHILHAQVRKLKPSARKLIIDTAAAGRPPVWDPIIPPLRVVPLWKGPSGRIERVAGQVTVLGKLLSMYPGQSFPGDPQRDRHVGVGHWIGYEGCTDAEAEVIRTTARENYQRWWAVLFELYREVWFETAFERWKISSIGVERMPWTSAP
jgi:hypothetical protein